MSEKRTAVLIDAGFLRAKLYTTREKAAARAARIVAFAKATLDADEELFRIYYYDCPPYKGTGNDRPHPILGATPPVNAASIGWSNALLDYLRTQEYVAVRLGVMSFDGWTLKDDVVREIVVTPRQLVADDFKPLLRQKGVDLRIGIDIALLAINRRVDRIILVAGDSDLVPAMKIARREGIQVALVDVGHSIKAILREHADFYRIRTL